MYIIYDTIILFTHNNLDKMTYFVLLNRQNSLSLMAINTLMQTPYQWLYNPEISTIGCIIYSNTGKHVIVVTWARGIYLICMPEARGPQAQGLRAYISGKSREHMLQVICITSDCGFC